MKDAVLTIRVAATTRRRLEALARREGRSLSSQAERLIEQGLKDTRSTAARRAARPLSGVLQGGMVPPLTDFRKARATLSTSLLRRTLPGAEHRR
jgi:hypothetical protein